MELLTLLANPKILAALGVSGTLLLGFCITIYRLYIYQRTKSEEAQEKIYELQEKRLKESQEMRKEFFDLAADMDKTLNSVIQAMRPKNGGK